MMGVDNETSFLLFYSVFIGTLSGAIISALVSSYFHYVNVRDAEEIKNNRVEYMAKSKSQLWKIALHSVFLIVVLVCALLFFLLPDYWFIFFSVICIILLFVVFELSGGIKQLRKTIIWPKWDYFEIVILSFILFLIMISHLIVCGVSIP